MQVEDEERKQDDTSPRSPRDSGAKDNSKSPRRSNGQDKAERRSRNSGSSRGEKNTEGKMRTNAANSLSEDGGDEYEEDSFATSPRSSKGKEDHENIPPDLTDSPRRDSSNHDGHVHFDAANRLKNNQNMLTVPDAEDLGRDSWTTNSFSDIDHALDELTEQQHPLQPSPATETLKLSHMKHEPHHHHHDHDNHHDHDHHPDLNTALAKHGTQSSPSLLAKFLKPGTMDEQTQAGEASWDWLSRLEQLLIHFFLTIFESKDDDSKLIMEMMPPEAGSQVEEIFQLLLKAEPDMYKDLGHLVSLAENWLIHWRGDSEQREKAVDFVRMYLKRVKSRNYYKLPIQVRLHKLGAFIAGLKNMGRGADGQLESIKYPIYMPTHAVNAPRLMSPRVKPATHFSRVVANILCGRPCDDPLPFGGVYADKLGRKAFKKTLHGDKEFKDYTDVKYGDLFEKKDIFYKRRSTSGDLDELEAAGDGRGSPARNCVENASCWLPVYNQQYMDHIKGKGVCGLLAEADFNRGFKAKPCQGKASLDGTCKPLKSPRSTKSSKIYEWVRGPDGKVHRRTVGAYTDVGATSSVDSTFRQHKNRGQSPNKTKRFNKKVGPRPLKGGYGQASKAVSDSKLAQGVQSRQGPQTGPGQQSRQRPQTVAGQQSRQRPQTGAGQQSRQRPQTGLGQQSRQIQPTTSGQQRRQIAPTASGQQSRQMPPSNAAGQRSRQMPPTSAGQQSRQMPLTSAGQQSRQIPPSSAGQQSRQMPLTSAGQQSRQMPPSSAGQQSRQMPPTSAGQQSQQKPPTGLGHSNKAVNTARNNGKDIGTRMTKDKLIKNWQGGQVSAYMVDNVSLDGSGDSGPDDDRDRGYRKRDRKLEDDRHKRGKGEEKDIGLYTVGKMDDQRSDRGKSRGENDGRQYTDEWRDDQRGSYNKGRMGKDGGQGEYGKSSKERGEKDGRHYAGEQGDYGRNSKGRGEKDGGHYAGGQGDYGRNSKGRGEKDGGHYAGGKGDYGRSSYSGRGEKDERKSTSRQEQDVMQSTARREREHASPNSAESSHRPGVKEDGKRTQDIDNRPGHDRESAATRSSKRHFPSSSNKGNRETRTSRRSHGDHTQHHDETNHHHGRQRSQSRDSFNTLHKPNREHGTSFRKSRGPGFDHYRPPKPKSHSQKGRGLLGGEEDWAGEGSAAWDSSKEIDFDGLLDADFLSEEQKNMMVVNQCWEKASKVLKRPSSVLVIPPAENLMLYLEQKFQGHNWGRGIPIAVRNFPNGKVFVAQYANGGSRVFYPHGGLAVAISGPSPTTSQILVVRDPSDQIFFFDKALLASLNSNGKGTIYDNDGVISAQYSTMGGFRFEKDMGKGCRWLWNQGGQRLIMKLNKFMSIRMSDFDKVYLNFYGNRRGFLVNVATGMDVTVMSLDKPMDPGMLELSNLIRPKSGEDKFDYIKGRFTPRSGLGFVDKEKHWANYDSDEDRRGERKTWDGFGNENASFKNILGADERQYNFENLRNTYGDRLVNCLSRSAIGISPSNTCNTARQFCCW